MNRSAPLLRALGLALAVTTLSTAAAAQGLRPATVFVQGGGGEDDVGVASIGATWPFAWRASALGGEFTSHGEVFLSQWSADARTGGGRDTYLQLGLVPMLRWRPAAGQSPWFVEAGIGVSVLDQRFATPEKTFSTRLNFSDNLAVGRIFGDRGQHELSLRWQHTSNAGIKKPNPGLDLVLVRYGMRF
jgi:lipid A 3-O-deacylase